MSRSKPQEQRSERTDAGAVGVTATVILIVCLVSLPYLPLLLAGAESAVFGTGLVEESCEQLGIHDELTALYDATIFRWFQ